MKHTKTPWKVGEYNEDYEEINILCVSDGYTYHAANVPVFQGAPSDEQKANAAFIVKACNNHAALVEALTSMVCSYGVMAKSHMITSQDMELKQFVAGVMRTSLVAARAALEAAKE